MRPRRPRRDECREAAVTSVDGSDGGEGKPPSRIQSTPLIDAVQAQDLSQMRLLLEAGADPDFRAGSEGKAALHWAAERGKVEAVRLLLDHGASVDLRKELGGATALRLAAAHAPEDDAGVATVELLVARGAEINVRTNSGWTPARSAAIRPRSRILEALLRCGAAVDLADREGRTPLMGLYLPFLTNRENAKLLVRHGADLDAQDRSGRTALMLAAIHGELAWAELLIQLGADATLRDRCRNTAADYAAAPPLPGTRDSTVLALFERSRRPELISQVWERRERMARLLRQAEAAQRTSPSE